MYAFLYVIEGLYGATNPMTSFTIGNPSTQEACVTIVTGKYDAGSDVAVRGEVVVVTVVVVVEFVSGQVGFKFPDNATVFVTKVTIYISK